MDQVRLQQWVETISVQYFHRPFLHTARFNHRLRTTGGRYLLHSHDIECNPKQLAYYGEQEFTGIIKHELCHYHLHLQGKGYKHQDKDFKALLKEVGGTRYCRIIPGSKNQEKIKHIYRCEECGQSYRRKRKIDTKRYVCGACKGRLKKL